MHRVDLMGMLFFLTIGILATAFSVMGFTGTFPREHNLQSQDLLYYIGGVMGVFCLGVGFSIPIGLWIDLRREKRNKKEQ